MLSNLPQDELIKVADGLRSGRSPGLTTGPQVDRSVLPKGGALAGYEINYPQLPADFYGHAVLTVTEGHGLLIENRYYSNDHFAIFVAKKDSGAALPDGLPLEVNGQPAMLQSGLLGEALLSPEKFGTLQDGQPRLSLGAIGGGFVGNSDPEALFPDSITYSDGRLLTWVSDGARITLLSNLPDEDVIQMANETTIIGKTYMFINPNTQSMVGQTSARFDMWGPTYIPQGFDSIFSMLLQGDVPDVIYASHLGSEQFVKLAQRAAQPNESLPEGETIMINGQPAVLNLTTGSLVLRPILSPGSSDVGQAVIGYTNAAQITWVVDGTWIQILANISREEAIRVAESIIPAE
jgi:hypothetical protein